LRPALLAVRAEHHMSSSALPFWSTASFGNTADTSPMELSELGEHLDICQQAHGRWFVLHCAAESLSGFVSARLVTVLAVVALLIGGVSLLF
jgi:hypothetical protein